MSQRLLRVRELLKREIGSLVARDYEFKALVTITGVDLTPDFRQGHVFVGVIGSEAQKRKAVERLNADRGSIQRRISKRVVLKNTPQLTFSFDESSARGVRTLAVIEEIDRQQQAAPKQEGEQGTEPDER